MCLPCGSELCIEIQLVVSMIALSTKIAHTCAHTPSTSGQLGNIDHLGSEGKYEAECHVTLKTSVIFAVTLHLSLNV